MLTVILCSIGLAYQTGDLPPPTPEPAAKTDTTKKPSKDKEKEPAKTPVTEEKEPAEKPTKTDVVFAKRALEADPVLANHSISMRMEDDKVVVEGTVPSEEIRTRAERLVTRAVAAEYILNKIRLEAGNVPEKVGKEASKQATPSDEERLAELKRVVEGLKPSTSKDLRYEIQTKPIPAIIIEGVVDTYPEKIEISRVIREYYVGLPVLNNAIVRDRSTLPVLRPRSPMKMSDKAIVDKKVAVDDRTSPNDIGIANDIKQRMLADRRVDAATVIVHVQSGIVTLRGVVGTRTDKVVAIAVASETPGVVDVVDDLRFEGAKGTGKGTAKNTDAVIYFRRLIRRKLPQLDRVDVATGQNGSVSIIIGDAYLSPAQLEDSAAFLRSVGSEMGVPTVVVVQ